MENIGKPMENHRFDHQIWVCPVNFPINTWIRLLVSFWNMSMSKTHDGFSRCSMTVGEMHFQNVLDILAFEMIICPAPVVQQSGGLFGHKMKQQNGR